MSINKVRTFKDFNRSGSARWANHDVHLQKPKPEFLGPGQEEISFSIRLDAQYGVNPEAELKRLRAMRDTGKLAMLIIGGEPVTQNLWFIESLDEGHKAHTGNGKLITAEVKLTLKEYPKQGGGKK
ncbi:phage tail protein [Brevibacillus sp. H7]|uniref:phage tail protein n=1 Tax=Brevibacillus sp. H7 TaxID=3349138 RepID=UPI0037F90546